MTVQHIARSEDEYVEDLSSVLEHTFNKMNAHGVENIKVKVSDLNSHDDFMAIHVILEPVNDQQFINLDHTFTETLEIMKSLFLGRSSYIYLYLSFNITDNCK